MCYYVLAAYSSKNNNSAISTTNLKNSYIDKPSHKS